MIIKKLILPLLSVIMLSTTLFAWDNVITHPKLTNSAVKLLISKDASFAYLNAYSNFNINTSKQLTFIDEGSVKEDYAVSAGSSWDTSIWGGNQDANVPYLAWKSHAYNPRSGETWYGIPDFKDASLYAGDVWNLVLTKTNPYFQIGRVCHLMEDMASPSHAHGDMHVDGDDLEEYSKTKYNSISFQTTNVRKPSTDGLVAATGLPHPTITADNTINFMKNVVWRTYYMTSYYGGKLITKEGNKQPDSELKRMFPYNNGGLRYDDGGWFSNDSYVIDQVGNNWIGWGIGMNPDWWECPSDPKYFYLENIDGDEATSDPSINGGGIAPAVFKVNKFRRVLPTDNLSTVLAANSKVFGQIYCENLYALSVEWAAGFVKYSGK